MAEARRQISQFEFERASARSRMHPESLAIAHAVLVQGEKQADVARRTEKTRSWVGEVVTNFMRHLKEVERMTLPTGWVSDTVSLPPALWPKVRSIERAARAKIKMPDSKET